MRARMKSKRIHLNTNKSEAILKFLFLIITLFPGQLLKAQNFSKQILTQNLEERGDSLFSTLIFFNDTKDSVFYIIKPNDGSGISSNEVLNISLKSDSVFNLSRNWRDATHLINFIVLKPQETHSFRIKVSGGFNVTLKYQYLIMSRKHFLESQSKKLDYRELLQFIQVNATMVISEFLLSNGNNN